MLRLLYSPVGKLAVSLTSEAMIGTAKLAGREFLTFRVIPALKCGSLHFVFVQ
jgi:hypothetical protein